jgi:hypothetical protein
MPRRVCFDFRAVPPLLAIARDFAFSFRRCRSIKISPFQAFLMLVSARARRPIAAERTHAISPSMRSARRDTCRLPPSDAADIAFSIFRHADYFSFFHAGFRLRYAR